MKRSILGPLILAVGCWGRPDAELVLSAPAPRTTEGGGTATLAVSLGASPTDTVRVDVLSGDPAEGAVVDVASGLPGAATTLEFTTANWDAPQVVTLVGVDDLVADGDVTWFVQIAVATSADDRYSEMDGERVTFTNADDDTPGIVLSRTTLTTWEAGAQTDAFTIALTMRPADAVTIRVSSGNPGEGKLRSSTLPNVTDPSIDLVFTPSDWSTPREVTVVGQGDGVADGDQSFSLEVRAIAGSGSYVALPAQMLAVVNRDVDGANMLTVSSGSLTLYEGQSQNVCVGVGTWTTESISVPVRSGDPTEILLAPAGSGGPYAETLSLTLGAGQSAPSVCFTVQAVRDGDLDGDQHVAISVGPTSSGAPAHDGLPAKIVEVWVANSDSPGVAVVAPEPFATSEAGLSASFTVALQSRPAAAVTVPLLVYPAGEGLLSTGGGAKVSELILTFSPTDWHVPRVVTLHGVDDAIFEPGPGHLYMLEQGSTSSLDPTYDGLPGWVTPCVNYDDDVGVAEGTLAAPLDVTGQLPRSGMVDSTASYYAVTGLAGVTYLTLHGVSSGTVTLTADDDGDFSSGTLCSFAASSTSGRDCFFVAPASGRIVIRVDGSATAGGAAFWLDVNAYPPLPADCQMTLAPGTIEDATTAADPLYSGSPSRSYCAALRAGQVVRISTEPPSSGGGIGDSVIHLLDPSRVQVAFDDDGGTDWYSLIPGYTATSAGWYQIVVRGYSRSDVGGYRLTVTFP